MRKGLILLSLMLLLSGLISVPFSVQAQAPAPAAVDETSVETKVFEDGFGRKVEISYPLTSIVSLAPSVSEMVCAAGICDKLVAVDAYSNYPESLNELEKIGGMSGGLDIETIVSLDPDLVLAAEINAPEEIKSLEDLGIPVYQFANPTDLDSIPAYFLEFGEVLDEVETMEAAAEDFLARLDAVREALVGVDPITVFYEIDASDPSSPWTTGGGTFIDSLITLAGGANIAAELDGDWLQISIEKILESDPDVIVLSDADYGVTFESVADREGWSGLSAVRSGAVYPIDSDIASRPGPRMADAAEILAEFFHPENFLPGVFETK